MPKPDERGYRELVANEGDAAWDILWQRGITPWDFGEPSPALKQLIEKKKFPLPEGRGFVPGCGNVINII
jgi:hypothetical protein